MRAIAMAVAGAALAALPSAAPAGSEAEALTGGLGALVAPAPDKIAQSYVVMLEPETSLEALAAAWALLEPDMSRARQGARVIELRLATEFDPRAVIALLSATKGVQRAEANFTIPAVEGEAEGEADGAPETADPLLEIPSLPAPE